MKMWVCLYMSPFCNFCVLLIVVRDVHAPSHVHGALVTAKHCNTCYKLHTLLAYLSCHFSVYIMDVT